MNLEFKRIIDKSIKNKTFIFRFSATDIYPGKWTMETKGEYELFPRNWFQKLFGKKPVIIHKGEIGQIQECDEIVQNLIKNLYKQAENYIDPDK